jgi:hypothetical protein
MRSSRVQLAAGRLDFTLFLRDDACNSGNSMKSQAKKQLRATLGVFAVLLSAAALLGQFALTASAYGTALTSAGASALAPARGVSSGSTGESSAGYAVRASANPAAQEPDSSAKAQSPPPKDSGMVWVNTETGVYHRPGSRWYGKTKKGKYMLEADAVKAGYKPAKPEK